MSLAELNAIVRDLNRHAEVFDLDKHNLGERLLDIAAQAILEQMDAELDPTGTPWPALSDLYATWKATVSAGSPMAVLFGIMKSLTNLQGVREISIYRAASTFGFETDVSRQEACYFQEGFNGVDSAGHRRNQPPRRFYSFNTLSRDRSTSFLSTVFARAV
jgi:hypothetical protein